MTDEQAELLLAELDRIIDGDRYPLSPRIVALREIRAAEALPGTPGRHDAAEALRAADQRAISPAPMMRSDSDRP